MFVYDTIENAVFHRNYSRALLETFISDITATKRYDRRDRPQFSGSRGTRGYIELFNFAAFLITLP